MNSPTPLLSLPPVATAHSYQRRTLETSLLRRMGSLQLGGRFYSPTLS